MSKPQGRDWHAAVTLLTGLAIVRAIVRIVCVDPPKEKPDLALLRVNRLVGAEARHRFYNSACFYINEYQLPVTTARATVWISSLSPTGRLPGC